MSYPNPLLTVRHLKQTSQQEAQPSPENLIRPFHEPDVFLPGEEITDISTNTPNLASEPQSGVPSQQPVENPDDFPGNHQPRRRMLESSRHGGDQRPV
jgi:hypothetical protein